MENENKIKVLKKQILNETNMTEEKQNQYLVELCKIIDNGKETNLTKTIDEAIKKWKLM